MKRLRRPRMDRSRMDGLSTKVMGCLIGSVTGGTAGGILSVFVTWLLGGWFFGGVLGGPTAAATADATIAAVPAPVVGIITLAVIVFGSIGTVIGGYYVTERTPNDANF